MSVGKSGSVIPSEITKDMAKDTGMAAILIYLIYLYFARDVDAVLVPGLLLLLNMAAPSLFTWPAKLWFGFSHLLGSVMTRVLLSLLYILLVIPVSLLLRLAGKDAMAIKAWHNQEQSVFMVRDHTFKAADMEKPY